MEAAPEPDGAGEDGLQSGGALFYREAAVWEGVRRQNGRRRVRCDGSNGRWRAEMAGAGANSDTRYGEVTAIEERECHLKVNELTKFRRLDLSQFDVGSS